MLTVILGKSWKKFQIKIAIIGQNYESCWNNSNVNNDIDDRKNIISNNTNAENVNNTNALNNNFNNNLLNINCMYKHYSNNKRKFRNRRKTCCYQIENKVVKKCNCNDGNVYLLEINVFVKVRYPNALVKQ